MFCYPENCLIGSWNYFFSLSFSFSRFEKTATRKRGIEQRKLLRGKLFFLISTFGKRERLNRKWFTNSFNNFLIKFAGSDKFLWNLFPIENGCSTQECHSIFLNCITVDFFLRGTYNSLLSPSFPTMHALSIQHIPFFFTYFLGSLKKFYSFYFFLFLSLHAISFRIVRKLYLISFPS